jgi:hypothetical protein
VLIVYPSGISSWKNKKMDDIKKNYEGFLGGKCINKKNCMVFFDLHDTVGSIKTFTI